MSEGEVTSRLEKPKRQLSDSQKASLAKGRATLKARVEEKARRTLDISTDPVAAIPATTEEPRPRRQQRVIVEESDEEEPEIIVVRRKKPSSKPKKKIVIESDDDEESVGSSDERVAAPAQARRTPAPKIKAPQRQRAPPDDGFRVQFF